MFIPTEEQLRTMDLGPKLNAEVARMSPEIREVFFKLSARLLNGDPQTCAAFDAMREVDRIQEASKKPKRKRNKYPSMKNWPYTS